MIEILTPDGYQPIGMFVDKGMMGTNEYFFDNGASIKATDTHRFQKDDGEWVYAKDCKIGDKFISINGSSTLTSIKDNPDEVVCDIEILHPNHRYFTNGISSHNTGGNALRYYLSARYLFKHSSTLKEQIEDEDTGEVTEQRVANIFTITSIKNKINAPFKTGKMVIRFGEGTDDFSLIVDHLKTKGIISNKGSFLFYKTTGGGEVKELGKIKFYDTLKAKHFDDMIKWYVDDVESGNIQPEDYDEDEDDESGTMGGADLQINDAKEV